MCTIQLRLHRMVFPYGQGPDKLWKERWLICQKIGLQIFQLQFSFHDNCFKLFEQDLMTICHLQLCILSVYYCGSKNKLKYLLVCLKRCIIIANTYVTFTFRKYFVLNAVYTYSSQVPLRQKLLLTPISQMKILKYREIK